MRVGVPTLLPGRAGLGRFTTCQVPSTRWWPAASASTPTSTCAGRISTGPWRRTSPRTSTTSGRPEATRPGSSRRLGLRTAFVGALGDDPMGDFIRRELAGDGIEALLFPDPLGTHRSVNFMYPDGRRKNFYDGKGQMDVTPDLAACRRLLARCPPRPRAPRELVPPPAAGGARARRRRVLRSAGRRRSSTTRTAATSSRRPTSCSSRPCNFPEPDRSSPSCGGAGPAGS